MTRAALASTQLRYRDVMRSASTVAFVAGSIRWSPACLAVAAALAACGDPRPVRLAKVPNNDLILGEYERHPPDGETAIRFRGDGSLRLAKNRFQLDADPPLAYGTWKLDADRLTLTYDAGICNERGGDKTGVYRIVISKIGIRFTKVEDSCERRSAINGQTWWRVK
jgi:hypothetical protein